MFRNPVAFLLAAALAAVGCQQENNAPELSSEAAAVTGAIDGEFNGVCGISIVRPLEENGVDKRDPEVLKCSCSLVADRVVLTAAHCIEENLRDDLE